VPQRSQGRQEDKLRLDDKTLMSDRIANTAIDTKIDGFAKIVVHIKRIRMFFDILLKYDIMFGLFVQTSPLDIAVIYLHFYLCLIQVLFLYLTIDVLMKIKSTSCFLLLKLIPPYHLNLNRAHIPVVQSINTRRLFG